MIRISKQSTGVHGDFKSIFGCYKHFSIWMTIVTLGTAMLAPAD